MTDDDRMNRARRIREMREGTRPDEEQAPDTDDGESTDEHADAVTAEAGDASADVDADAEAEAGATLEVPGADVGDVTVDVEELAEQADIDPADGDPAATGETGVAGAVGMAGAAETQVETAAETRVLEFGLGNERYCLDIEYVEEIVKREAVTRVPNTPDYVEGVVDLRGQITTILDPKELLDIDTEGEKELIVVFDPEGFEDQGAIGWIVDEVTQVTPVVEDEVNDSPVDEEYINGVVERDEEFVIWTEPGVAIEHAAG
ncbi:chemotaxis protein CheW [Halobacteriales archaeon QH_10_67_22]|nr:MAG: chemotaxis protein CheW [Halobacteriales archaeon QH_10_67_22]